jgi:hypothetical protein
MLSSPPTFRKDTPILDEETSKKMLKLPLDDMITKNYVIKNNLLFVYGSFGLYTMNLSLEHIHPTHVMSSSPPMYPIIITFSTTAPASTGSVKSNLY